MCRYLVLVIVPFGNDRGNPMKSWLTTHYAHPEPNTYPWQIYLQDKHKDAVDGIAVGDRVFYYEFKSNRAVKGETPRPPGAQGIVRIATVSGSIYHRDGVLDYVDGGSIDWAWGVKTDKDIDLDGFVPRNKVVEVLGYGSGSRLRSFNAGKGIKILTKEQAQRLLRLFKSGAGA